MLQEPRETGAVPGARRALGPGVAVRSIVCAGLLLALAVATPACSEHVVVAEHPAMSHTLSIANVMCLPDLLDGRTSVSQGATFYCTFDVLNSNLGNVLFGCEDDAETELDCSRSSALGITIEPPESSPRPDGKIMGFFRMIAADLGTRVIVLRADDGTTPARFRLQVEVVADDGIEQVPEIRARCGEQGSRDATVFAGDELHCMVFVSEPDPYQYPAWNVAAVGKPSPPWTHPNGPGPGIFPWKWQTMPQDAGDWTLQFKITEPPFPQAFSEVAVTVLDATEE